MRLKQYINENILNEKTFKLNKDIDFIYNNYFKKIVNNIKKGKFNIKDIKKVSFPSSELKNRDSQKAHNLNPIVIKIGLYNVPNYNPITKEIFLTLNLNFIHLIKKFGSIEAAVSVLPHDKRKEFEGEIDEHRVKGIIHHELSHWINDTLHNKNIEKLVKKAKNILNTKGMNKKVQDIMNQKKGTPFLTDYEIDAQIHSIVQLKRYNKDVWDIITFEEMIKLSSPLTHIYKNLKQDLSKFKNWKRL